jgi:aerobic C4-dicarboxylate transport protein
LLGYFYPAFAVKLKPLGDGFIKLIRMMIAPIIFTTVVTGIASMEEIKEVGRIGVKALLYFEGITCLALILGLIVANVYHPGSGLNIDPRSIDSKDVAGYTNLLANKNFDTVAFFLNIIPDTFIQAFSKGDILPVLLLSILFGFGLLHGGDKLRPITSLLESMSIVLFAMVKFIMRLAPLGALGAMAFAVGAYGPHALVALSRLLVAVYGTSLFFVFIVLGIIARLSNFSLWRFLLFIKDELFIVLGTSSSEAVLPQMMLKLETLGCQKTIVGLVLPTGYAFNMDGTSIYLTIAALFIAQAFNIDLSFSQQVTLFAVLLLTSKGAAAVTGGGFIVLAATLTSMHTIPIEGLVLLLGVDRFMSEARSLTNLVGNGVATIVVSKWEKAFDSDAAKKAGVLRKL